MTEGHDARAARQRELLRAQPWGRLVAQLTAIALKRSKRRSIDDAQDLAQTAIADAHRSLGDGGWDPDKGELVSFLVAKVIGLGANERRRKRNLCEVWLDEEAEGDDGGGASRHEKHFAEDAPAPDEALHRLRFASTFRERLLARLAGDALALALVPHMMDGVTSPMDLAAAVDASIADVRDARRRIRYHAEEITKELSIAAAASTSTGQQVMQ